MPHETAAVSARSVYTIQPCTMSLQAKPHTSQQLRRSFTAKAPEAVLAVVCEAAVLFRFLDTVEPNAGKSRPYLKATFLLL